MEDKILESNRLIAEFMGAERGNDTDSIKDVYTGIPVHGMKTVTEGLAYMKFHKNWNWLMPVVEKIEQEIGAIVTIESVLCVIEFGEYYKQTYDGTKLKAIYFAVVEFIKWYNQNKS